MTINTDEARIDVCLLNYTNQSSNWGLNACSEFLYKELDQYCKSITTVDYDIIHGEYLFDHFKIFGKRFYLPQRRSPFRKFLPKTLRIPLVFDDFDLVASKWSNNDGGINSGKILERLIESDLIIFNAEGSCYRKNFGARSGLFLLWYSRKVLKKRAIFINGSITITRVDDVLRAMINECSQEGVELYVREDCSLEYLRSCNIPAKLCPDSAFETVNQLHLLDPIKTTDKYFCVSKSMLPMSQSIYCEKNNLDSFGSFIREINQITGWKPVFLAKDSEDLYLQKYVAQIPGSSIVSENISYKELVSIINMSEMLVSGRYHHIIFAMCASTKILPLDTTSPKIRGLLKNTPYYNTIIDPTSISTQIKNVSSLLSNIKEINQSYQLRDESMKRAQAFKTCIANIFKRTT